MEVEIDELSVRDLVFSMRRQARFHQYELEMFSPEPANLDITKTTSCRADQSSCSKSIPTSTAASSHDVAALMPSKGPETSRAVICDLPTMPAVSDAELDLLMELLGDELADLLAGSPP